MVKWCRWLQVHANVKRGRASSDITSDPRQNFLFNGSRSKYKMVIHSPSLFSCHNLLSDMEELSYLEWPLPWCTFFSSGHRSCSLAASRAKATPPLLSLCADENDFFVAVSGHSNATCSYSLITASETSSLWTFKLS